MDKLRERERTAIPESPFWSAKTTCRACGEYRPCRCLDIEPGAPVNLPSGPTVVRFQPHGGAAPLIVGGTRRQLASLLRANGYEVLS